MTPTGGSAAGRIRATPHCQPEFLPYPAFPSVCAGAAGRVHCAALAPAGGDALEHVGRASGGSSGPARGLWRGVQRACLGAGPRVCARGQRCRGPRQCCAVRRHWLHCIWCCPMLSDVMPKVVRCACVLRRGNSTRCPSGGFVREGPWRCQLRQSFVLECRGPAALGAAFCIQPGVRSSKPEYLYPPGRSVLSHKLGLWSTAGSDRHMSRASSMLYQLPLFTVSG